MLIRRPHLLSILLSLCVLACSGARCTGESPAAKTAAHPPKPRPDFRLLVLTDPKGYLEPCGCQQRPLGGVDKLAKVVADARKDGVPTLLVAAGDLTFGTTLSPEDFASAATQEAWRAETLVAAWNQMGMAAVAPGKLDLVQPPELLAKLVEASKFPWLADNLVRPEDGAQESGPLTEGRVVEVGGIKVGLLGVIAPDLTVQLADGAKLDEALDKATERTATRLRSEGASVVVALVHGDRRDARRVAGAGADIVVMGGIDVEEPLPPAVHEDAILVHAGRQGQRLVTLEVSLSGQGAPRDESAWSRAEQEDALREKVKELRARIDAWEKAKNVAEADLANQRARLTAMEQELSAGAPVRYEGRWFDAQVVELSPEVKGDKEIAAAIDAYDKRVNSHNQKSLQDRVPLPAKEGEPHYAGSDSCKGCHEAAYDWWKKTKHGRAYATLEDVHKEFNLSCVGCHVTGYNEPGGSTVTHVDDLKDVGCESCHGPGSQHNAQPEKQGLTVRDTPEAVCASCHSPEHSDRFMYEAFKSMLVVPGHGLPVAGKAL